ncbi:MAG: hypothetical protein NVSMB46_06490 [Candidatus Saccharimonadales bacterium]
MNVLLLLLLITVIFMYGGALYCVFKKAHVRPWAAIMPLYNATILAKISGNPSWWGIPIFLSSVFLAVIQYFAKYRLLGLFISMLIAMGMVCNFIVSTHIARKFSKSYIFGVVIFLFPIVGYCILGYGKSVYQKNNQ